MRIKMNSQINSNSNSYITYTYDNGLYYISTK